MKILVITGGDSSEREVSLNSAKNVVEALLKNGYQANSYDLKEGYEKLAKIAKDFDVLFPVLHGEEGEGGKLHEFLGSFKKPTVGSSNYKGFQEAWFKIPFKQYCDKEGIRTPKWKIIKSKKDVLDFGFPCVVKGSSGGSSHEVFIYKTKNELKGKFPKIDTPFFVEEYIEGKELTAGILGDEALPIIEIIPPSGEWFSYENKYTSKTQEIVDPKDINGMIKEKMQQITLKIHRSFNLGSYSRMDFILDNKGRLFVLEVNTIPGLTSESLLPKMAQGIGLSFEQFIKKLVEFALESN